MNYEVIEWRDACDFKGSKSDLNKKLPLMRTYGPVIYEDEFKVVLLHHENVQEEEALLVDDDIEAICIPKAWIHSRVAAPLPQSHKQ